MGDSTSPRLQKAYFGVHVGPGPPYGAYDTMFVMAKKTEKIAMVEVRDFVIWVKHIHGNSKVRESLDKLDAGELIELRVDDCRGIWEKMNEGKDGRPTPGIKPIGRAREKWHTLYADNRGDVVSITVA